MFCNCFLLILAGRRFVNHLKNPILTQKNKDFCKEERTGLGDVQVERRHMHLVTLRYCEVLTPTQKSWLCQLRWLCQT